MNTSSTDRIEKVISLRAAPSRVWQALTDTVEFGEWFGVRLEGPKRGFAPGEAIQGQITYPSCEHMILRATIERVEPEHTLTFRWCPYALDPGKDYSGHPTTLVEFRLEETGDGTRLTVTESGFDDLPPEHREECFVRNEGGWTEQADNIRLHVDG